MVLKKPLIVAVLILVALSVVLLMLGLRVAPVKNWDRPVIVTGVTQWAALADQVVGAQATVVSLLSDPNADPHSHEATTSDAAHVAQANVVIENGAGYDTWLSKLVQSGSSRSRTIDVATLMNVRTGANPHIFYNVVAAERVVRALSTTLAQHATYPGVATRSAALLGQLSATESSLGVLHHACANVKVAATEDVTGYLLNALGVKVITPEGLRRAIGNSVDPSVQDLALALAQLHRHPAFLVNNVQTATPLTDEMVAQARAQHVPVINVTETMTGTNYVTWMNGVVDKMRAALRLEGCVK